MIEDRCISCQFFGTYLYAGNNYAKKLFEALAAGAHGLLAAVLFAYGIWVIYRLITNQQVLFGEIVNQVIIATIISVVLLGSPIWWDFYNLLLESAFDLGTAMMEVGGADTNGLKGIFAYLYAAETPAIQIAWPSFGVFKDNGAELGRFLASLALLILFLWIWWNFSKALLKGLTKFLAVGIGAPLVLVAAALPATRKMFYSALKFMLIGFFEIVLQGGLIGFVNTILSAVNRKVPNYGTAIELDEASGFLGSDNYLFLLLAALAIVFVQGEFSSLASQLADAWDRGGLKGASLGSLANSARTLSQTAQGMTKAANQLVSALSNVSPAVKGAVTALNALAKLANKAPR